MVVTLDNGISVTKQVKKKLGKLVARCFETFGGSKTAEVIDNVKNLRLPLCLSCWYDSCYLRYHRSTRKERNFRQLQKKLVNRVERDYNRGLITEDERYKKVSKL